MKYKCPCCFVRWVDNVKPLDFQRNCLCSFCLSDFEKEELFDWQFDNFKEIDPEGHFTILYINKPNVAKKFEKDSKQKKNGKPKKPPK